MPYKYFGKTTSFRGNTLWEIVGNLKNFGVGRIVVRSKFERYPEKSYMRILKVETLPEPINPSIDDVRKVRVLVEKTFRGQKSTEPEYIERSSYKTDYRLIPKDEEESYCKSDLPPYIQSIRILPRYTDYPPLLKELIIRENKTKGEQNADPKLELVYNAKGIKQHYRVAKEGETPTITIPSGLGTPISPSLYETVKW